ncbi:phosphoglycolate phosphatase [Desulfacinum hydrothermale DSM 13146]|uniref:phosphoglycolate phosphatase n=1 Tax=Desulfacinum hydrothermale DSM 13146 TaxID=1121390 RepID=A0A1W1XPP0_9BACT|nr:HAD family hydrolase [Desulfacinum hydrothermale]SMC25847.1 phosphoglycolate phosphatase [Desulfacinum hydrothermale DSM 13146]
MRFRAALLDLDGTLLDTLSDLAEAMNRVLRRHGFRTHPVSDYKGFVGDGVEWLVRRALPDGHRMEQDIPRFVDAMRREYKALDHAQTRPYPGIAQLLEALTERGVRLAVLSNKMDDFTKEMVARFFPHVHFDAVVGAAPGAPVKPDPTAALEIAREIGIVPEDWMHLGDTAVDMKTAVASGMFAVGALWGFRSAEELIQGGAQVLVRSPGALHSFL